jgi:ppGpp synthetase/RelA/SpoT-type nucleotidyltranferase
MRAGLYSSDGDELWSAEMAWAEPHYSNQQVDEAGDVLIDKHAGLDQYEEALLIVNNWRSSHNFPLNTFQVGLRRNATRVDSRRLLAQRIKRLSSIEEKLRRFRWLKLSEIQDIGGCRAVMPSVAHVDDLVRVYKASQMKHKLDHEDDYIRDPKKSGYRGVHLIYRYTSDRKDTYNGLKIELQFRSPLQHAWATAVETVGTFTRQALKSSRGEREWLRFFALMGSAIAIRERTAPIPSTPTKKAELFDEVRDYARRLDVEGRLEAYGRALQTLEKPGARGAHYFLLALDPAARSVTVTGYKAADSERASKEYLETERLLASTAGGDAVLVSVESLSSLRRAYPNYFLDTRVFLDAVKKVVAAKG